MLVLALWLVVFVTVALAGVGLLPSYVVMFIVPQRCVVSCDCLTDAVKLFFRRTNHNDVVSHRWLQRNDTRLQIFGR